MSLETLKTKVGLLIEKAQSGGNTDELEAIIDNSGVLDSTEGTVEEKVEQVVDKAVDGNLWYIASGKMTTLASNVNPFFTQWAYSTLPKTDFSNVTSLSYQFFGTQLEYIDYYINSAKCTNFNDALSNNKKLKWIVGVDLSSATNIYDLFLRSVIETIQEPLNIAKVTNTYYAFQECKNLKYIRFVAECIKVSIAFPHASLLTAESIQSIIDGLATVETAQTLTLHADVKAKLTQTQLDTITGKNWSLA
jgi:hypothetical protein